jgi:methyl-accepting chemotaxis protein
MFKNMKISLRLGLSFSIMIFLILVLIGIGLNSIRKIHNNMDEIVNVGNVRTQLANKMISDVREVSIALRSILLDKDVVYRNDQVKNIEKYRMSYDSCFRKYEELVKKDETTFLNLMEQSKILRDESRELNNIVVTKANEGKFDEALNIMLTKARPKVANWIITVDELVKLENEKSISNFEKSNQLYSSVQNYMIILGCIAFLIAVVISFMLSSSITRPLKIATDLVLSRDPNMDLSAYQQGGGELGSMIQAFSRDISEKKKLEKELIDYRDQLEETVKERTAELSNLIIEVRETVNVLAASSSQILAATTQVATGTAETAAAINETSTTVEEVQQASKQSSQKAQNVADSAQKVAQVFQNGQKAVEETSNGMAKIKEQMDSIAQTIVKLSEQSQSIGGIIASVSDIADQSNLLAVNAAIEAAKAGEQGKGFAVVAQEIKNLASQSKQATLKVRNILNDVQKATGAAVMATEQGSKAVESGLKQSLVAGEAIRILAESSNEAVQASTQIVASSQQQVVGMDQIGIAMQNISQAGTETAVSMTQAERSARSLYELGQKLKDLIGNFKE